jgi:hypothetical protein
MRGLLESMKEVQLRKGSNNRNIIGREVNCGDDFLLTYYNTLLNTSLKQTAEDERHVRGQENKRKCCRAHTYLS